jgi:hypothetical protein
MPLLDSVVTSPPEPVTVPPTKENDDQSWNQKQDNQQSVFRVMSDTIMRLVI